MKTAEEWIQIWDHEQAPANFRGLISDIQSDAFHAGKLEGLKEAREIVRCYGVSDNVAEYTIETVCESLQSKPKETLLCRPED